MGAEQISLSKTQQGASNASGHNSRHRVLLSADRHARRQAEKEKPAKDHSSAGFEFSVRNESGFQTISRGSDPLDARILFPGCNKPDIDVLVRNTQFLRQGFYRDAFGTSGLQLAENSLH